MACQEGFEPSTDGLEGRTAVGPNSSEHHALACNQGCYGKGEHPVDPPCFRLSAYPSTYPRKLSDQIIAGASAPASARLFPSRLSSSNDPTIAPPFPHLQREQSKGPIRRVSGADVSHGAVIVEHCFTVTFHGARSPWVLPRPPKAGVAGSAGFAPGQIFNVLGKWEVLNLHAIRATACVCRATVFGESRCGHV